MSGAHDRATVLHADLDCFFASVEQRDDPSLRGRPVGVGPGIITAASYEARAFGVRAAMGEAIARRLCPDLVVVPARFPAYVEASRATFEVFDDTTPLVEGLSIDEAFLEVGGLGRVSGTPVEIARRLREEVRDRVGLPISVGVARTKFLAKVASGVAKPDGLLVVEPGRELAFLHPLPVTRLWGVGPATAERLASRGVRTIGDLAAMGEVALTHLLGGATGRHLHALASGRDPRPVERTRRRRSVGAQSAMGRGPHPPERIDARLVGLVDRVCRRMRAGGRAGRSVTLTLRFADYTRITRSRVLPQPSDRTEDVLAAARLLLRRARPLVQERGCTLVGVAVSNLVEVPPVQGVLPFEGHDTADLDRAVDRIRAEFGNASVTRAVLLGRHTADDHPTLDALS